uniref:Uncharacterized protein n=1 Tax=Arion vulgaris TaxID=1028688 RepID=A0A0B7B8Q9_9EUPU
MQRESPQLELLPEHQKLKETISGFRLPKKEQVSESVLQNQVSLQSSTKTSSHTSNDRTNKMTIPADIPHNHIMMIQQFEEMRRYKGHKNISDKQQITDRMLSSSSSSSSATPSVQIEKKLTIPTSANRPTSVPTSSSSSENNHVHFLRYSRETGSHTPVQKIPHATLKLTNQHILPQKSLHQQQHEHLKQKILRDHSLLNEDSRFHAPVIRVRSYPMERQQIPSSLQKPNNQGQPWSIPRVKASTTSRPHSLTLPSTRHHDGALGYNLTSKEFQNYNPSASPKALRSSSRLDSDNTPQHASASSSSTSTLSSNHPRSILKNSLSLDQSDLGLSLRPLLLPRAHSDKNRQYVPRDFDFSSILTTNQDPLAPKPVSIQIKGQVHGQTISSGDQQRSTTSQAALTKFELNQDGRSTRKSVTFNSTVLLHPDKHTSTDMSLFVDV